MIRPKVTLQWAKSIRAVCHRGHGGPPQHYKVAGTQKSPRQRRSYLDVRFLHAAQPLQAFPTNMTYLQPLSRLPLPPWRIVVIVAVFLLAVIFVLPHPFPSLVSPSSAMRKN